MRRDPERVELIHCPFCTWRYAGLAGGRRQREVLAEHLALAHGDVSAGERTRRMLEYERTGRLVTPLVPLPSK